MGGWVMNSVHCTTCDEQPILLPRPLNSIYQTIRCPIYMKVYRLRFKYIADWIENQDESFT